MLRPLSYFCIITLLLVIPLQANAYSENIEFVGVKWQKDWLDILIVGGTDEQRGIVIQAVGDFMYEIVSYSGQYDKWHYNVKAITQEEFNDMSWYLRWDIIIQMSDDYWKSQVLGEAAYLQQNGDGVEIDNMNTFDRSDIVISTMYNSTHHLPDWLFYNNAKHEFGHSLGLGHNDDNCKRPVDVMAGACAWSVDYSHLECLMYISGICIFETTSDESEILDVTWYRTGYRTLSQLELHALIMIYGIDGWNYPGDGIESKQIPVSYGESFHA